MTILYVRPDGDGEATLGPDGQRSFKQGYLVKSDTPFETPDAIFFSGLVPVRGGPHPQDPFCLCQSVTIQQDPRRHVFYRVRAEWSTTSAKGQKESEKEQEKDPPDRRPKWRYEFQPLHNSLPADLDGLTFTDSAGTPFDPPPDMPIWIDQVTIERFETSLDRARDRKFLNATNQDTWDGAKSGTALITQILTEEFWERGRYWFKRTFVVLVSPRIVLADDTELGGYDPHRVLDAGPKVLDRTKNPPKPVPATDGGYVDGRAVLLDGQGNRLGRDANGKLLPAHWLEFHVKKRVRFWPLRLTPPWK